MQRLAMQGNSPHAISCCATQFYSVQQNTVCALNFCVNALKRIKQAADTRLVCLFTSNSPMPLHASSGLTHEIDDIKVTLKCIPKTDGL